MGMITSMDDIVKALTTTGQNQHPCFSFDNRVADAAGPSLSSTWITSFWRYNKTNGANGKVPDGALIANGSCDKNTLGAQPIKNATSGRQLYLLGMEGALHCSGTIILYDRLAHYGGLSGVSTVDQPCALSLTRNAVTGEGNEIWVEINTLIGSTATTAVVTYANQDGVTRATPAMSIGGSGQREEGRILKFSLADGDTGVRGIVSVKLNGTTGTAGNFSIVVARPLLMAICETGGAAFFRDCLGGVPSIPAIDADACLAYTFHAASGGTARGNVMLHMIEV